MVVVYKVQTTSGDPVESSIRGCQTVFVIPKSWNYGIVKYRDF